MPLALECVCSDTSTVCKLTVLTLALTVTEIFAGSPTIGAIHYLTIYGRKFDSGAPSIVLPVISGEYDIDLPIADWEPCWGTIIIELATTASLTQIPSPAFSAYDLFKADYHIREDYECRNVATGETSTHNVDAYSQHPDASTQCGTTDIRAVCTAGVGVRSIFYKSTSLNACGNGCVISDGGFQPAPSAAPTTNIDLSGEVCLCATGGTGDYTYAIVKGTLPSGMTLNTSTGCIEGVADGITPASSQITFRVMDSGGGGFGGRGDVTVGGTCVKSGANVLRVSGGVWDSSMVGHHITIDGVIYTVTSVLDLNNMVVA